MGAALVLIADFGLGWLLGPVFRLVGGGWLLSYVLTALLIMLIAVPAGMFVYSLDFRQGRIFALVVAAGHIVLNLLVRWAVST